MAFHCFPLCFLTIYVVFHTVYNVVSCIVFLISDLFMFTGNWVETSKEFYPHHLYVFPSHIAPMALYMGFLTILSKTDWFAANLASMTLL